MGKGKYGMKMDLEENKKDSIKMAKWLRNFANDILDGGYIIENGFLEFSYDHPTEIHAEFETADGSIVEEGHFLYPPNKNGTLNLNLRIKEIK